MRVTLLIVTVAVIAWPSSAMAEEATVHLESGGVVHGEVIVYLPDTRIRLRVDGETVEFPADEILRVEMGASDAPGEESEPAEEARPAGGAAFRPRAPDIALHEVGPDESTTPLCTGNCSLDLAPGTYTFAISRFGRTPIEVPPVAITSDAVLVASYRNRSGLRTFGWILAGAGAVATLVAVGAAAFGDDDAGFGPTTALIGILPPGLVSLGVGITLGLFIPDSATLGVRGPSGAAAGLSLTANL